MILNIRHLELKYPAFSEIFIMAGEDGVEEINGQTEELVLDNEPYDEDENGIFCFLLSNHLSIQSVSLLL